MKNHDPEIISSICAMKAKEFGVYPCVHPTDFIFHFLINNPSFNNIEEAIDYYFRDAANSAKKLGQLISDICDINNKSFDLLEFASGYGCVTRHLHQTLPDARIASCDIHLDAVDFIEKELNAAVVLSHAVPEKLTLSDSYDVVFALSFFSHMPRQTWGRWLKALADQLREGGHLIFTTHGEKSKSCYNNPEIGTDGFWFRPTSEQADLNTSEYGSTITLPKFVLSHILNETNLRPVFYREGYWWGHQDVYVLRKD